MDERRVSRVRGRVCSGIDGLPTAGWRGYLGMQWYRLVCLRSPYLKGLVREDLRRGGAPIISVRMLREVARGVRNRGICVELG